MEQNLQTRGKYVVGALMVASLVFALILLQQQFDQGDYRHAIEMMGRPPPGGRYSVNDELVARAAPNAKVVCEPKLTSSFAGTLDVTCSNGEKEPYRFSVDLVRKSLSPKDPRSRSLMDAVEKRNAVTQSTDGGG